MKLSIIIPVFNEEKTIQEVLKTVLAVALPKSITREVIVVDDGSTDNTISNIKYQISKTKGIKFIQHNKNQGKGAAVRTGIENATGDYCIIQDADLEYNPSYISFLISFIINGEAQVVYGTRLKRLPDIFKDERNPLFLLHYFGNRFLSLIASILYGQWITDMETGYKLFPREAVAHTKLNAKGFEFEPEITAKLLKKHYKITEIPIKTRPRDYKEGKKLNAFKEGPKAMWILIKYRLFN